jgi:hypothetical protein
MESSYKSPLDGVDGSSANRGRLAQVGLVFSLAGWLGIFAAASHSAGAWLVLLCVPGLLVSLLALRKPPRRLAAYGAIFGLLGCLFIGTLCRQWLR